MKTADRRRFLAGGLALAGLGSQEAAAAQEPQAPLRVGVVAFRTCFEKYDRMKEVEEEIKGLKDEFARDAEKARGKIEPLTDLINGTKEPDALYLERVRLRGHAEYDFKVYQEVGRRRLRDLALFHESRINAEIRRVVALVAGERKLHLVLRADEPLPIAEEPEGAARAAAAREMIFHEPALDITDLVIGKLNAEWKKAWTCPKCKRKTAGAACPCGDKKP